MRDDQFLDFMAQMGDYMRSNDQRFEQMDKRFEQMDKRFEQMDKRFERIDHNIEQLVAVMHSGFERVINQLAQTNERVDKLTSEVREVKADIRDIKADAQVANRRLQATFEQTARLTEADTTQETRLVKLENEAPSNAELHQRVLALEEQMRRAS